MIRARDGKLRYTGRGMRVARRSGLLVFIVGALAALASCAAPHTLISARHTKCPVRKLEIRELKSAPDREDWIAVCGEQRFACSTREKERRLIYACHALSNDAADASTADAP